MMDNVNFKWFFRKNHKYIRNDIPIIAVNPFMPKIGDWSTYDNSNFYDSKFTYHSNVSQEEVLNNVLVLQPKVINNNNNSNDNSMITWSWHSHLQM